MNGDFSLILLNSRSFQWGSMFFSNRKGSSDEIIANLITTAVLNANLLYMYTILISFRISNQVSEIRIQKLHKVALCIAG